MNWQKSILISLMLLAIAVTEAKGALFFADSIMTDKAVSMQAENMDRQAAAAFNKVFKHADRDSLAIYHAVVDGINFTLKCDEYDRMPNRRGKVKTRYENDNIERMSSLHPMLMDAGRFFMSANNMEDATVAYSLYIRTAENRLLKDSAQEVGWAAYHLAQICIKARRYKLADEYADIALRYDESAQKGAEIKAQCMRSQMITEEDSVKYLLVISRLYETEPTNETYFAWLMDYYSKPSQKARLENFVDKELENNPDTPIAWILKGEIAMHAKRWDEAIDAYKHADEIDPSMVPVIYNIGVCLNSKALETRDVFSDDNNLTPEEEREVKQILAESRNYFERVRAKDPHRNKVDWVKPLYMVYSVLGEKIKADELKPLVTGFKEN